MIRTVNGRYIKEEFSSLTEFLKVLSSRENKRNFGFTLEQKTIEEIGCSKDEAIEKVLSYGEGLETLKTEVFKDYKSLKPRIRQISSPQGYQPLVPNAIMGLPNSMLRNCNKLVKTPLLEVNIDGTYPCSVGQREVKHFFTKVLAHCVSLEASGTRVQINLMFCFSSEGTPDIAHLVKIRIKDGNLPLCLERVNFPLTHSGMLRAFVFEWYETLPGGEKLPGYGHALYTYESKEEARRVLDRFGTGKEKYVFLNSEYKTILGGNP